MIWEKEFERKFVFKAPSAEGSYWYKIRANVDPDKVKQFIGDLLKERDVKITKLQRDLSKLEQDLKAERMSRAIDKTNN